uniref:Uncharacterized protein n=1 Tax=Corethron hystrix TaxID=216773 RepID=A0A7S1FTZ3_9STRA
MCETLLAPFHCLFGLLWAPFHFLGGLLHSLFAVVISVPVGLAHLLCCCCPTVVAAAAVGDRRRADGMQDGEATYVDLERMEAGPEAGPGRTDEGSYNLGTAY